MKTQRKRDCEKAVRVNVSIHPDLFKLCPEIFRKKGYSGLSDYVAGKIRLDARLDTDHNAQLLH
jgi:hypothetical protein